MINQLLWVVATSSTTKSVKIICDVTDVFALLIHYVHIYKEHGKHNHNAGYQNGHPMIDIYEVIDNMIAEQLDWALILQVHALSTWVCHRCCISSSKTNRFRKNAI